MDSIHLNIKEAKFLGKAIHKCSDVVLNLYENTKYHQHFYHGFRYPIVKFQWPGFYDISFGERIWEAHKKFDNKKGLLELETDSHKFIAISCSCVLVSEGADPTLIFTFKDDNPVLGVT